MANISMKAVCSAKGGLGSNWTALAFGADESSSDRNPDEISSPPYISISINVKPEFGELFEQGQKFTLTLTPSEN